MEPHEKLNKLLIKMLIAIIVLAIIACFHEDVLNCCGGTINERYKSYRRK